MNCVIPPKLDDGQLLAYIVGNAPAEVHQHLEQCPDCRSRLATLQGWQSWLMNNLYRTPCPSSLDLGEYKLQMLGEKQKAEIEQHLGWCPHCSRELQLFSAQEQAFVGDRPISSLEQLTDRVRIVMARLRNDLMGIRLETPQVEMAGIRGQETTKLLIYDADELEISLMLQADAAQPSQSVLLGGVSGPNDLTFEVDLLEGTQLVSTTNVDSLGNFTLPILREGQYTLILHSDTREIYIDHLDL